jgi:T5SS/PEP-CTERM-associated repeat protein/autotransporter-associated beta strand protein
MSPASRRAHALVPAAAFLSAALLNPAPAAAVTATWIAPSGGSFGTTTNWSTGAAPTSADTAIFARGPAATFNVTFVGPLIGSPTGSPHYFSDRAVVGNNAVSFVNSSPTRLPGTYTLSNPTTAESGRALTVADAATDTAASLTVAVQSLSAHAATVGNAAGSTGTLTVTNGSQFNVTATNPQASPLIVGNSGSGTLNVANGADVNLTAANAGAALGNRQGSSGTLNVTGPGSTFNASSVAGLVVGQVGAGTLNVSAGGQVNASVLVGHQGAGGTATVTGPGSAITGGLTVGMYTDAAVHVLDGGTLNVGGTRFAALSSTAHGTLNVTGPGSVWNNDGELSVGHAGRGTVNITAGARLDNANNPFTFVGHGQDSTGTVNLSGVGSAWNNPGPLYVGRQGRGTVNVSAGTRASATTTHIAELANSDGALTVDGVGAQATWTNAGNLTVGRGGRGSLTVGHGAHVSTFTATAGQFTNSTGTILLDGLNSTLAVTDQLQLAVAGSATLDVLGGAKLTAGSLHAGVDPFAIARITVDGPASSLAVGGNTVLSQSGSATLTVRNAASATLNGPLFLSTSGTASTINITSNATLTVHGHVSDGSTGHSTLTLDGGTLDLTSHNLGAANPINTLNFRSGTLRNVAQINNGATGLTKTSPGALTLEGANTYTGPTAVQQGTLLLTSDLTTSSHLEVAAGALVRLPQSAATPKNVLLKVPTLAPLGPATLDLTDNKLALTATPADQLRAFLLGGNVFSSLAAADPQSRYAIGYATAAQLGLSSWADTPVNPPDLLATMTLKGDANLDGTLNADDYALLDRSYARSLTNAHWSDGDFNYDGQITSADYLLIDTTFFRQAPGFSPGFLSKRESQFGPAYAQQLLTAIPEPAALTFLLATYPLLPRPRRKS